MKILVVGGGGREDVILQMLSKSRHKPELFISPGNAGSERFAERLPFGSKDIYKILGWAVENRPDLTVVAPDDPLAMGLVDLLQKERLKAFGPTAAAARIESSKSFAKNLMKKHGIPTADFAVYSDMKEALEAVVNGPEKSVVKADGLALGKGVFVCESRSEAENAVKALMADSRFGKAGETVLIEERMSGPELSVLLFTDGKNYKIMPTSRDHKRAFDGDKGPNTGGMGAVSPGRILSLEEKNCIEKKIIEPTLKAMRDEGCPFMGVLYAGLMFTPKGPVVIEFNSRFGDPEAQTILPLLKTDLVDILEACTDGKLADIEIEWSKKASCCLVLASGGYPGSYEKGMRISGIEDAEAEGASVFHAGTGRDEKSGAYVTAGGRVLNICAAADTPEAARIKAYEAAARIKFRNMQFRGDIGLKV